MDDQHADCVCGHTRVWHSTDGERCEFHCGAGTPRCPCGGYRPKKEQR